MQLITHHKINYITMLEDNGVRLGTVHLGQEGIGAHRQLREERGRLGRNEGLQDDNYQCLA